MKIYVKGIVAVVSAIIVSSCSFLYASVGKSLEVCAGAIPQGIFTDVWKTKKMPEDQAKAHALRRFDDEVF